MASGIIKALFGIGKSQMKTIPWTKMTPELHNQLNSQLGKLMLVVKSQNLKLTKFQQDYLMNQLKHMEEFEKRVLMKTETPKPKGEVRPFMGFTPKIVPNKRAEFLKKYTKDGQPNDAELNALANEYEILSKEAKELGDAGENYAKFSQLNKRTDEIEEIIEFMRKEFPTDDFASGGLARAGFGTGALVKLKDSKLFKEFVEKLFIKSSNDIRLGKGIFKNLDQKQKMVQHDNLTKLVEQFQKTGKFDKKANEYFGIDAEKAFAGATKKVKSDNYLEALDKRIMDEMDLTKSEMSNMSSTALDDLRRNADPVGMKKQFGEITEGRGVGDFANDPNFLREVTPVKKVEKPVPLVSDDVLAKAYDEVFYQKPSSGDYKYDADVLADSIAEQLGKGSLDDFSQAQQFEIHNTALKRVTDDLKMKKTLKNVEEKMILSDFDVKGKKGHASGGIAGQLHLNEGGRVPMIFGGSAGLKAMIKNMIEGINKGRKNKIKTLFPKYSVEEKELLKLGEKYLPRDAATLSAREIEGKAEGIQVLIDRLKNDKKIIEQMAKNKAMNDPGLDFLMKHLEKMENMYPPNLKKYTDIDKDILDMETIKKNLLMKDRKLNAQGGRASLSKGGLAKILGV